MNKLIVAIGIFVASSLSSANNEQDDEKTKIKETKVEMEAPMAIDSVSAEKQI